MTVQQLGKVRGIEIVAVGKLFSFEFADQGPESLYTELADIHPDILKAFSIL